jgi:23S rRNA pseudouridine1911/1915/1917 synthase
MSPLLGDRTNTVPSVAHSTIEDAVDHAFAVAAADDGERLDRVVTKSIGGLTRSRSQALIKAGQVQIGSRTIADPGARLKSGQQITVSVPPAEPATPEPQNIPLAVVHEDAELIVIDKPAGIVVHPAAGHAKGTLVNALIAHCGSSLSGIGGVRRPGIVHRLDKDTSGLLVVAKTDNAHAKLSEQFAAHGADGKLVRTYFAICWGVPDRRKGAIDAPLMRSETNRTKISVAKGNRGRRAVTHYEVVETFSDDEGAVVAALMRLQLETGRTHQIRVHLAHVGHPVLGDAVYGAGFASRTRRLSAAAQVALAALQRQALHAAELGFEHPRSGRSMRFQSPLPSDMAELLRELKRTSVAKPRRR